MQSTVTVSEPVASLYRIDRTISGSLQSVIGCVSDDVMASSAVEKLCWVVKLCEEIFCVFPSLGLPEEDDRLELEVFLPTLLSKLVMELRYPLDLSFDKELLLSWPELIKSLSVKSTSEKIG